MRDRPDRLLLVGCIGLALALFGTLLGGQAAPLAVVGLTGTLLAFGGFVARALVAYWRGRSGR